MISETEELKTRRIITFEGKSYQKSWEKEFPWMEFDRCKDRAFCPICKRAASRNKTNAASFPPLMQVSTKVLTESEYGNWKKGKQGIKKHNVSGIHIGSTQAKLVHEQDTLATITLTENTKKNVTKS